MTSSPLGSPSSPPAGPSAASTSSRRGAWLFALALVAIACWDLGGRAIYHRDLARFAVIAREMIQGGDWLVPHQHGRPYVNKPILYIWLVAAPSAPLRDPTAFTLRLPSALALVAMALSTSMWARVRTGSVEIGRWAGLFVVTTWIASEFGRTGRPDMLAAACGTIAATFLDRAMLGRGTRRDPWIAGLALGAGLLSKGPIVMIVPVALLLVPRPDVRLRERLRRARPLLVLLVAVVVAALWIVPVWLREGGDFVKRLVVDQVKDRVEGRGNHQQAPWFYLASLPLPLMPWAPLAIGAAVAFCWRRVRERLGPATLPLVALATLAAISAIPTKDPRYALVLVPPLSIVAAQGVAALVDRFRDATEAATHLLVLGIVAIALGLAAVVPMVDWPSTIPWVVPPAIVAIVAGALAVRRAREADSPAGGPRALAARWVGLAIVLVACGLCVYWAVFARYLVHTSVQENRAVAAVLPAGVPTALLIDDGLEPDDLYDALPRALPLHAAAELPSRATAPQLVVVCVEDAVEAAERARGETAARLLRRERPHGRLGGSASVLVVLRFGP